MAGAGLALAGGLAGAAPGDAYAAEPAGAAAATDVRPGEADLGPAGNNIMQAWKAFNESGKAEKEKQALVDSIINVMKQGKKDGIKYDKGKAKEILNSEYWTNAESKIKSFLNSGHADPATAEKAKPPEGRGDYTTGAPTSPEAQALLKQQQQAGAALQRQSSVKEGKV